VKRSAGDEPMWVAIHKCIEATLEISLYSYLKLGKTLFFFFLSYIFSFQENRTREQNRFCVRGSSMTQ
jgi:uncharacterized membrane protein